MNLRELVTKGSVRLSDTQDASGAFVDLLVLTKRILPRERDRAMKVTCRGRRVYRTSCIERTANGGMYVWCQFEDTNQFAWINPANLKEEPLKDYVPYEV